MAPDRLAEAPRKRSWKWWIVAAAGVIVIALIVFLVKPPAPSPVSVWFAGSAVKNGKKVLFFEGTNGLPGAITYLAGITTNRPAHAKTIADGGPYYYLAGDNVSASETFTFSFEAPQVGTYWRIMWYYRDKPYVSTPWKNLRANCSQFLKALGMPKLARKVQPAPDLHFIAAADVKE